MLQDEPEALIINSFSKYFSMAGWRLGWLVVPPDLIDAARARMGNLFLTPPSLAQHAGLVAFDCRDELEGHIAPMRATANCCSRRCRNGLRESRRPTAPSTSMPISAI
jgi:aspartate/methionine/tyrosine aminotransferase